MKRVQRETRRRQIAMGICLGMSVRQMAEALDLNIPTVYKSHYRVIRDAGMSDRVEFALLQNAGVREVLRRTFPGAGT
jgi:DNA-binding NarL/FixJ family response regulator